MSETVKNLQKTISLLNTEAKPEVLQDLKKLFEDANKDDLTLFVKECDVAPIIQLLKEDASVAEQVRKALLKIAAVDTTHALLCDSKLLATFDSVLKSGSVIRCRVYETVVQIATISEEHFQLVLKTGFIQQLFKDAEDFSDVLQAVNCVEILSYLADTEYGRRYLETEVLSTFQTKILNGLDAPSMEFNLIAPQVFKLFGVFGRYDPKVIFETYKDVVNSLLRIILMENSDLIYGAIETVGFLGRTVEGKTSLTKVGFGFSRVLRRLGEFMSANSNKEATVRSVEALEQLLSVPIEDPNGEMETLTETWFSVLMPSAEQRLFELSKQPFKDVRLPTYKLIRVIATHLWGQKKIASVKGMIDHLLNRSRETDKSCKEAKYDIISQIVKSPFSSFAFDRETIVKMKKYQADGPFHVEMETAVATEEA